MFELCLRDEDRYGYFKYEDEKLGEFIVYVGILGFGEQYYLFDIDGNLLNYSEYDPCEDDSDEDEDILYFILKNYKGSNVLQRIEIKFCDLVPIEIDEESELFKKIQEEF